MFLEHWGQGEYEIRRTNALHEARVLRLDTSKANSLMAWRPVYSIRDAVRQTAAWYRAFYTSGPEHAFDMTVSQIDEYVETANAKGLLWAENDIHALSDVKSQVG
jgi:CDP-glucose 4,6-dehydratase